MCDDNDNNNNSSKAHSCGSSECEPAVPGAHAGETKRMCAVCLESYSEGDKVRVLPCLHRCVHGNLAQLVPSCNKQPVYGSGCCDRQELQLCVYCTTSCDRANPHPAHAVMLSDHAPGKSRDIATYGMSCYACILRVHQRSGRLLGFLYALGPAVVVCFGRFSKEKVQTRFNLTTADTQKGCLWPSKHLKKKRLLSYGCARGWAGPYCFKDGPVPFAPAHPHQAFDAFPAARQEVRRLNA